MFKAFYPTASIIAAALLISGCGVKQDKPIITYERNAIAVPNMKTVNARGLYVLFPGDGITPLAAIYLHPGDQYGFQRHEGRVAGCYVKSTMTNFVSLDDVLTSDYVWKYQGEKNP